MAMNARTQPTLNPLTHRLTAEELRARWAEIGKDPLLARIPYKIELNERGSMEVSPATNRHAYLQAFIAAELRRSKPDGITFTQCPIETEMGVRVVDVAWGTTAFHEQCGTKMPLRNAPELCIEITSRMITRAQMLDKVTAYLAAGAHEVWLVGEDGSLEILSALGDQPSSSLGIEVALPF
jgi:hypothetical protein